MSEEASGNSIKVLASEREEEEEEETVALKQIELIHTSALSGLGRHVKLDFPQPAWNSNIELPHRKQEAPVAAVTDHLLLASELPEAA